jgi:membrane protein YqaA with SNARE-associated domain
MKRLLDWIQGFAVALGGPGLFLIGFLDSSFLSFPEVNDLLVVMMVTQHKHRLLYYSVMATLGSVAGCLALYYVARRGGERFVRKRFKAHHVEAGLTLFRKYGLLVVIVPALLPPPAPFKIFVLLAGVAAIPVWQFTAAVAIARFTRYFGEGLLAVFYGERAAAFLTAHAKEAGLWLAGIALVLGVAWVVFTRRRGRRAVAGGRQ